MNNKANVEKSRNYVKRKEGMSYVDVNLDGIIKKVYKTLESI